MCGFAICCWELISFGFSLYFIPLKETQFHISRRLRDREQSLHGVRMKNGVQSTVGEHWHFTLVLQYLHGLPRETFPLYLGGGASNGMCTYMRPTKVQPLFKLADGEGVLTWNAGLTLNRKLSVVSIHRPRLQPSMSVQNQKIAVHYVIIYFHQFKLSTREMLSFYESNQAERSDGLTFTALNKLKWIHVWASWAEQMSDKLHAVWHLTGDTFTWTCQACFFSPFFFFFTLFFRFSWRTWSVAQI